MRKSKEIKFINYIEINGESIPMDSLSEEERKKIAIQLNDKAMAAIGYVRVNKAV